jgi:hypothetical protein
MTTIIHEALITLLEAKCTISKEKNWTKKAYARYEDGNAASPYIAKADIDPFSYSLEGAMIRSVYSRSTAKSFNDNDKPTINGHELSIILDMAIYYCIKHIPFQSGIFVTKQSQIITFNDNSLTSHLEVIHIIDAAIIDALKDFDEELEKNSFIRRASTPLQINKFTAFKQKAGQSFSNFSSRFKQLFTPKGT